MGVSAKQTALFLLIGTLTGCASTSSFKPAGFTDQQIDSKLNELRVVCLSLKQGEYIHITFYEGQPMLGYFDAYNKMNDTLWIAKERQGVFDRGEPYYLQLISGISRADTSQLEPETPNPIVRAVKTFFTVDENDPQRLLLTQ